MPPIRFNSFPPIFHLATFQEVRDYETDKKVIVTTVTLLGKKRSLVLCLTLFTFTFSFLLLLIIKGAVSLEIFILSPLTYFIMAPITRAIINEEYEEKMLREIERGGLSHDRLTSCRLDLGKNLRSQSRHARNNSII